MFLKASIAAARAAIVIFLTASSADAAVICVAADRGVNPPLVDAKDIGEASGESALRYVTTLNYRWDDPANAMASFSESDISGNGDDPASLFDGFGIANAGLAPDVEYSLEFLRSDGLSNAAALITHIADRLFSRNAASEQALAVFLGAVLNDAPPLRLNFITDDGMAGGRKAQTPAAQGNDAPLPLFLAGIAGLGFAGRKKMDAVRAV